MRRNNQPEMHTPTRANNFTALRIIAALLVLGSHCWPLTGRGLGWIEKLSNAQMNGGYLGVSMFFAISGYLVTESYLRRRDTLRFMEARALRIFPGLAVCLLYCLLVGAVATTLPSGDYWSHTQTWSFFWRNLVLDLQQGSLPGVFTHNPLANAVNGSLWTLPGEWTLYCMIAVLGLCGILAHPAAAAACLVALIAVLYEHPAFTEGPLFKLGSVFSRSILAFLLGALFQLNRDRVLWRWQWAAAAIAAACLVDSRHAASPLLIALAIGYTTLWLALTPALNLQGAERWGDPSYGIYVYAFPTQQLGVHLFPGIGPNRLFWLTVPVVVLLAYASWWAVEKPALARKGWLAGRFERLVGGPSS